MDTRFRKTALNSAIALALAAGPLAHAAEGDAVGGMFQVNGLTAGYQRAALWDGGNSVAMDANGDFVVVWTDNYGYDGEGLGVFISRFAADGSALDGGDVQVNGVITSDAQTAGAVAAAPDGRFVVTFLDYGSDAVYARLYAADGTPRGDEFQVDEGLGVLDKPSDVTMAADGAFVIVWQEDLTTIKARRYDSDGNALDAAVTVTSGSDGVEQPVVAMDPAGNYVIAWRQAGATGTDIMVRRFLADGSALDATAFVVNTASTWGGYPDIAVDGSGNFVVVWQQAINHDIYAKRFAADGNILNDEFLVFRSSDCGSVYMPHVAMDAEGDFAVVATNYSGYNVYLQRYDSSATPLYGSPIVADASNDNIAGSVAMDPTAIWSRPLPTTMGSTAASTASSPSATRARAAPST